MIEKGVWEGHEHVLIAYKQYGSSVKRISHLVGELSACAGIELNPRKCDRARVAHEVYHAEVGQRAQQRFHRVHRRSD